jgi:hypothetical protein
VTVSDPKLADPASASSATEADVDETWSDDELEALALGAQPDAPLDDDAVPINLFGDPISGLLPSWYMPPAVARHVTGWRTPVIVAIVAVLLGLEALGLCSIFGQVVVG